MEKIYFMSNYICQLYFSGPLSPAVDDRMELIDNIETLA